MSNVVQLPVFRRAAAVPAVEPLSACNAFYAQAFRQVCSLHTRLVQSTPLPGGFQACELITKVQDNIFGADIYAVRTGDLKILLDQVYGQVTAPPDFGRKCPYTP
jgi:hypothetical protein